MHSNWRAVAEKIRPVGGWVGGSVREGGPGRPVVWLAVRAGAISLAGRTGWLAAARINRVSATAGGSPQTRPLDALGHPAEESGRRPRGEDGALANERSLVRGVGLFGLA